MAQSLKVFSKSMKRILSADDDETLRKYIELALRRHRDDYDLVFAEDGEQAVALYKEKPFEIILMDLLMPKKDGFLAAKEIRAYEEEKSLEPAMIIAVTSKVDIDTDLECLEAGMNGFLTKPFRLHELVDKIRSLEENQ